MGDISDYYKSWSIDDFGIKDANEEFDRQNAELLLENYMLGIAEWETKDDGYILVSDMTDSHIKNCLNFAISKKKELESPSRCFSVWIKIFKAECKKRKI